MKTVNVKAYSLSDVKKQSPFELTTNATIAWKKAGSPIAGEELKTFLSNYLTKATKNVKGLGCYVVMDQAVSDSRENPYTITNIPTEGKRKFRRIYELVNSVTGEILGAGASKEAALVEAKKIVSERREELGVGVKHKCRIVEIVVEGNADAFEFEYTPSQNAKQGTFLLFGHEPETL